MVETARVLRPRASPHGGKTIVLTGAMVPYAFGSSDGLFNLGSALSFVQVLPPAVCVAMNGRCFRVGSGAKEPGDGRLRAGLTLRIGSLPFVSSWSSVFHHLQLSQVVDLRDRRADEMIQSTVMRAVLRMSHRDLRGRRAPGPRRAAPVHLAQRHERSSTASGPFSRDSRAIQVSWSNRWAT